MWGQDKPGVSPTAKLNKMNALERLSKSKSQKKTEKKSAIGLGVRETIVKDWEQTVKI